MHCAGCATGIEKGLLSAGAEKVSVDFTSSVARFELSHVDQFPSVIKKIEALGYRPVLLEHGHDHSHDGLEKKFALCAIFTAPLLLHMVPSAAHLLTPKLQLLLALPVFCVGFFHFGKGTLISLRTRYATMDVLIFIGIVSAFIYSVCGIFIGLSSHELYFESSATITTIVLLGNLLEARAAQHAGSSLEELSRLRPTKVRRIVGNDLEAQRTELVSHEDVKPDDLLLVAEGERIPADGVVLKGTASIDESFISGESLPRDKISGMKVIGGTLLVQGNLTMRAEQTGDGTVLARVVSLVQEARSKRPKIQRIGDAVSAVFVPVVLVIALGTFCLGYFYLDIGMSAALLRAIAVLVIACPCAMGLATPAAVTVGLGLAAKNGIIIRGGDILEAFSKIRHIIFDKTGTLTAGKFKVRQIKALGPDGELREIIVTLARHSRHPIAQSLTEYLSGIAGAPLYDIKELKGLGIEARDGSGNVYSLGSIAMAKKLNNGSKDSSSKVEQLLSEFDLLLFKAGHAVSAISVEDLPRPDAASAIAQLQGRGIAISLLSGDRKSACERVASLLGISQVYAEKLPDEKSQIVRELTSKSATAFVGDGINDAAALMHANVGISLEGASHLALHSSQIILADTKLAQVTQALAISANTMKIIKQNLFWAFIYNVLAIPFAMFGILNPLYAAFAMTSSDIIVILNSLRLRSRRMLEL